MNKLNKPTCVKGHCATCSGGVLASPQVMRTGSRSEPHPQASHLLQWFCDVCKQPFGGLLAWDFDGVKS